MAGEEREGRKSKLGLALAAGGVLGGVYEVGALRALEESIEGLDLNDLHVIVGVSAGAFVGSHLANGVTVSQMVAGLLSDGGEGALFDPSIFFVPAYRELRRRGAQLPSILAEALVQLAKGPEDPSFIGTLESLGRSLPVCLFASEPIREYLHRTFSAGGRTDDFRRLPRRFRVVATNVETGEPVVFGGQGQDHIPISRAVQASTAVPGLYQPVEVEGRVCVDGVLLKTMHASVALDQGADLLLCVNPLVPMNVGSEDARDVLGRRAVQRGGLPTLLSQAFRILIHSRVSLGLERYNQGFPKSDLVLFQPDPSEHRLFTNLFRFHSRRRVCEIAYDQTRRDLLERREVLEPVFQKHGLSLKLEVLQDRRRSVWDCAGGPAREVKVTDLLDDALQSLERSLVG
ncbi:MAG: patatin-like phospholipase family protein [Acidobacteria bacterium]|nr:patatin-like phospholipase family protein [Acidobacteriota bacterium]